MGNRGNRGNRTVGCNFPAAGNGVILTAILTLGLALTGCGLDGLFSDECKPGEICEGDQPFEQKQVFTARELLDRYFPKFDQVEFADIQSGTTVTSATYTSRLRVTGTFVPGSQAANPESARLESAVLTNRQDGMMTMHFQMEQANSGNWAAVINTQDFIMEQTSGEHILTLSIQAKHGVEDIFVSFQYDSARSDKFYIISASCVRTGSCVEGMNESGDAESTLMQGIVSDIPLISFYLFETKPDVYAQINSVVSNGLLANINFTIYNDSPVFLDSGVHYSVWANRTSPPTPGSSSGNSADSGGIPANGQVTIDFSAPGSTLGISNSAYIVVDDNKVLDESNEDNNVASFVWTP